MNDSSIRCRKEALSPGDHACFLYETEQQHRAVIAPFLYQGLKQGERAIYIVHDHRPETILSYLRDYDLETERYLKSKQLVILTAEQTYLQHGCFDKNRMCELLQAMMTAAKGEGFQSLRITGETNWTLQGFPGSKDLIEYEAQLTDLAKSTGCLSLCQYHQKVFPAPVLLYILATHPYVIAGLSLYNNPYYLMPPAFLGQEIASKTLRSCLSSLIQHDQTNSKHLFDGGGFG